MEQMIFLWEAAVFKYYIGSDEALGIDLPQWREWKIDQNFQLPTYTFSHRLQLYFRSATVMVSRFILLAQSLFRKYPFILQSKLLIMMERETFPINSSFSYPKREMEW